MIDTAVTKERKKAGTINTKGMGMTETIVERKTEEKKSEKTIVKTEVAVTETEKKKHQVIYFHKEYQPYLL